MADAETNRKLDALVDMATRTSQDVTWIKSGMVSTEKRLSRVETKVTWASGFTGAIGVVFGAIVTYFTKTHS